MSSSFPATRVSRPGEVAAAVWSLRRADRASLRAAWWGLRAVRRARRQLAASGIAALSLPRPPALPGSAARGVSAVLRRRAERCLVSAAVWQEWHAAHGSFCDLVIGVSGAPGDSFGAHAWLDQDGSGSEGFVEIYRHPARR